MNSSFGKLKGQIIEYAPTNARYKNTYYCPAPPDVLINLGYKIVVNTPYPDDGNYYISSWSESKTQITKVWKKTSPPPEPEPEPLTPVQEREKAYETELICKYGNGVYTVDEMNRFWSEYSAEGNKAKVKEIQSIISKAKAEIRKKYPDKEE